MAIATPTTARIPIWSPGRFTALDGRDYEFTPEDLAASAQAYSPAAFAAPWVKGHPASDDPAQGWARSLEWDGEYLWAESDRIDPAFAEEVRAGRWGKISPRFFLPDDPSNPVPGTYYLRHIGWLGAAAPANKRLPAPQFADPDGQVSFVDGPELPDPIFADGAPRWSLRTLADWARRLREHFIEKDGRDAADKAVPEYVITELEAAGQDPIDEAMASIPGFAAPIESPEVPGGHQPGDDPMADENSAAQVAFAEREAELQQRQADIDAREQRLAEQEAERHQAGCAAFADGLVNEGRILPADASFVAALLAGIPDDDQVSFADGDNQVTAAAAERLRDFLSRLPVQVDFAERAAPEADAAGAAGASFAAPAGYSVDPQQLERHNEIRAYQAEHNCDYATAAAAVS